MVNRTRVQQRLRTGLVLVGSASIALGMMTTSPAVASSKDKRVDEHPALQPVDAQAWVNPDDMTWDDYTPVPGTNWNDPSVKGSTQQFTGAVVLVDFADQDFLVTQEKGSHVFGNPVGLDEPIPREEVREFYQDWLNTPNDLNRGHTVNEYWMEDSNGRLSVDLETFGPYRLPGKIHEYGLESGMNRGAYCPPGDTCGQNLRTAINTAWFGAEGSDIRDQYDLVFYVTAGHDESGTWQEFGEMMFQTPEDVPDSFGPPNKEEGVPNWAPTRYVPWTSWKAAANHWPNASGGTSTQAESSGHGVFAHEFSHILRISDNYNNPYGDPLSRSYSGIWEMLSRGSFNGPGGPHTRWQVPPTHGGSMGAHHMLRNKMKLDIVDEDNVAHADRESLAASGLVVAEVTAREVQRPGEISGINVKLTGGGDKSPACDWTEDYLCDRGGYDNYTVEVVDRMGSDSFTPDSGVLLAKTKDQDRAPFIWVVDANPQDIDLVDFYRPDGTPAKVSLGDFRQLSDGLFKAGVESGSDYEYVDEANGLHFYVLDLSRDADGILSYTVAVRALDGAGNHARGVKVQPAAVKGVEPSRIASCTFPVANTGGGGASPIHDGVLESDVFRLDTASAGKGWTAWSPHAIVTAAPGSSVDVPVYVSRTPGSANKTEVTLTATSESDPSKSSTASCSIHIKDTTKKK